MAKFEFGYLKDIGSTILDQLGGGKFLAMVGGNNLKVGEIEYNKYVQPYMMVNFKMNPTLKSLRVIYEEGKDLYVMQFLNRTGKVVKEFEEVYAEDLVPIFEDTTKLYTHL